MLQITIKKNLLKGVDYKQLKIVWSNEIQILFKFDFSFSSLQERFAETVISIAQSTNCSAKPPSFAKNAN